MGRRPAACTWVRASEMTKSESTHANFLMLSWSAWLAIKLALDSWQSWFAKPSFPALTKGGRCRCFFTLGAMVSWAELHWGGHSGAELLLGMGGGSWTWSEIASGG